MRKLKNPPVLSKPEFVVKQNKATKKCKVIKMVFNSETKTVKKSTVAKDLWLNEANDIVFKLERGI